MISPSLDDQMFFLSLLKSHRGRQLSIEPTEIEQMLKWTDVTENEQMSTVLLLAYVGSEVLSNIVKQSNDVDDIADAKCTSKQTPKTTEWIVLTFNDTEAKVTVPTKCWENEWKLADSIMGD